MVCNAQGTPSPTRISNTLLPIVLDTAMSPRPVTQPNSDQKQLYKKATISLRNYITVFSQAFRSNKALYFRLEFNILFLKRALTLFIWKGGDTDVTARSINSSAPFFLFLCSVILCTSLLVQLLSMLH